MAFAVLIHPLLSGLSGLGSCSLLEEDRQTGHVANIPIQLASRASKDKSTCVSVYHRRPQWKFWANSYYDVQLQLRRPRHNPEGFEAAFEKEDFEHEDFEDASSRKEAWGHHSENIRCDEHLVKLVERQCLEYGVLLEQIPDDRIPLVAERKGGDICVLHWRVFGYDRKRRIVRDPEPDRYQATKCFLFALRCILGESSMMTCVWFSLIIFDRQGPLSYDIANI